MKGSGYAHLLKDIDDRSEVWWDSSPSILRNFRQRLQASYPAMSGYIYEILPDKFSGSSKEFTGSTTNPRLVTSAILSSKDYWAQVASKHAEQLSPDQMHQFLYNKAIGDGADILQPLWAQSRGRYGWLSAQVDPTYVQSSERMLTRGIELSRQGPNVMIKVPGNEPGYRAIRKLVALGHSVNNTFCYTVSQFSSCIGVIKAGIQDAIKNGVNTTQATYVITFMIGRFSAQPELDAQAAERGIMLSPAEKRWAEIAIYNELQALIAQSNTPARLLLSSLKVDRESDGTPVSWHLEKTGGAATVYTMTPEIFEFLVQRESVGRPVSPATKVEVPDEVLTKLLKIPYFHEAYFDGAIDPYDYSSHPAFISTCSEAMEAHRRLRDFASLHCPKQFSILSRPSLRAMEMKGDSA